MLLMDYLEPTIYFFLMLLLLLFIIYDVIRQAKINQRENPFGYSIMILIREILRN